MKRLKTFVSPRARNNNVVRTSASKERPPLSMRVSSTRSPRKSTSPLKDDLNVHFLKEKVANLKERIEVLDSDDVPFEGAHKENELQSLNDQLQEIQVGISTVDQERQALRESKTVLEKEKQDMQEELFIREREVQSLVRRCQSQNEKMRESAKLRASNSTLSTQLEGLKSSLSMKDDEISQIDKLQKELKDCKDARRELRARLATIKKDHDDVVDTLNSCFVNMQKLQEKQQENDEDRKRDLQRSELALEKQRLAHQENANKLKGEIQNRQDRVDQMETILRDNMATSTALRRERAELKESLQETLSLKDELAQKLDTKEQEHESFVKVTQADYNLHLEELRVSVIDKDLVIGTLEGEVSTCMSELMALSEEVENSQTEKSQFERGSQESIQGLEQEVWALKEQVSIKDLDITLMSSSLSTVEEEKVESLAELKKLRDRVKELEEENAFIMDLEQQLDDCNFSVLDLQEGNDRIQETFDQALSDLKQEFAQQKEMWHEMEKGLLERGTAMEIERDHLGASLTTEQETCTTLRTALHTLKTDHDLVQQKATSQEELIVDVQGQLEQERRVSTEKDAKLSQLRAEKEEVHNTSLAASSEDRENHAKTIASLQQHLEAEQHISDEKTAEVQRVASELSRARDQSQQMTCTLKGQLQAQEKTVASLTEKLNVERRAKIDTVKSLREDNESAREGWRNELNQANDLLQQKRSEVESLRLELVSLSGKGEEEQIEADRTMKVQGERLDVIQRELDEQRRQLHQKTAEADRFKAELLKAQEHLQSEISSLLERGAEQERKCMSLEADLRRERSACEGKDSALGTMGTDMEIVRQQLADKQRTVRSLQKEVENLRAALDQDLSQRDEALTAQVQEMSLLATELTAKRQLLEDMTDQRDNLQDDLNSKDIDLSKTREQLAKLETCMDEQRSQLVKEEQQKATCHGRIKELEIGLEKAATELAKKYAEQASLEGELVSLHKEASPRESLLKSQSEKISSLELDIEHYTAISENKAISLNELRTELCAARSSFESDLAAARKKQTEQESVILSLQADLHHANLDSHKKETNISSITAELDSARFKFNQESKIWANEAAEREDAIARKEAELTSLKSLLEQGTTSLSEEVKTQTAKVCSLTKSLSNLEYALEEKERKNRALLAENDIQISALQQDLQSLLESKEIVAAQYRAALKERDETTTTLNTRVDDLQREAEGQAGASQTVIISLKHKLQKAEIDLAITQDELRDVKMIDLKEAEEAIESLESSLQTLRKKSRTDEASNLGIVSDLRAQVDQLESKLNSAERGSVDTKHLHDKTVLKMQGESDALKQENEALNLELKEKFNKLNERHSTITTLTAQKGDLEQNESRLVAEIDSLESDCKKSREEQEKTALALEREIEKQWATRQDDDIEFLTRQSRFQKKLQEYEGKVSSLQKEVSAAEEVLEGRTKILAAMVAHNKGTEEGKERALSELKEEKEASEKAIAGMEETQQELARVKVTFTKIEDQLLSTIQSERELREVAEVDLENAHAQLKTKRDDKELTELEKENEVLRDKVRRQEAFLIRKIQKDKVLRDRNAKPSGIATPARPIGVRSGIATPARPTGIRKPLSSARKGLFTPAMSENRCPDELDEILG